ncbi:hypothetical protein CLG96_15335 [Sphingomonas oleivorans]|uniref:LysM domain-containing protein n=1 Tax=Sphingomonas oleivorans TaxID=1735121 RepID=A0A2T5FUZ6_9SPHN|nr:M23 family metallopeptidase [Sphingomonas oleivorans]PTQ08565.1 hypothetical protein CLG96_15335 [Sphingomonas oleivorans]
MSARRAAPLVAALLLAACVADRSAKPPPAAGPTRMPAEASPRPPARKPAPKPTTKPKPAASKPKPRPAAPKPAPTKQPPAAWETRSVTANAVDVPASTYTVVAGDTLRRISDKTGASSEGIARANGIGAPFLVKLGQRLKIPAGRYHRVGKGESGIAIARTYGVDWSRIATLNALEEPYILRDGQRLLIPSRAEVSAMTMEQRAAAFTIDIDDLVTGGEPALARNAAPAPPVRTARRTLPSSAALAEPSSFAGRFVWPLSGRIIRPFGPLAGGQRNDGINIAAKLGDPIMAASDGVVAYAGNGLAAYGGLVLIRHGDGWLTAYGHADELLVKRGQSVKRGQLIARAGESGFATQPQLHFEIRQGRKPVNPLPLLPRPS